MNAADGPEALARAETGIANVLRNHLSAWRMVGLV
jgi:hypothetical protein